MVNSAMKTFIIREVFTFYRLAHNPFDNYVSSPRAEFAVSIISKELPLQRAARFIMKIFQIRHCFM